MNTNEQKDFAYSYSCGKPPPDKPKTTAAAAKDAQNNRGFPTPITRHPPGQITSRTFQKP